MPPRLIAGRYRVEREIGRGGMGSVWLCRDERLGRPVAVKQVGGLPGESSMHLARALREARHSAALNHPNVVAIFDALEQDDRVWLVMEYVPSRTLDQVVREDGPLAPRVAARIGADVADGLAAAHALGTVHRDVKPSNVLVREDDGRALIADFGIARTVGQEQLTRSGLVTGTPTYFAPELARGMEPSPASDVWALGVTLYVAVEGEPPYDEQVNAIALLNTIASRPPPEPTRAGPLDPVMHRMLDPDPATRTTMAEAARELRRIAQAPPEPAPIPAPVPAPEPAPEPVPEPEPMPEPAPGPDSAAVDPIPTPVRGSRPPDTVPSQVTAVPPPRRRSALWALGALVVLALVAGGGWWLTNGPEDNPAGPTTTPTVKEPTVKESKKPHGSPSPSDSGSAPPSSSAPPSASPSDTPESSGSTPASQESPSATGGGAPAGSPTELVDDYYGLLPDDTDSAWAMLSPSLQRSIGRGTFDGFWATIDDVRVGGTEEVGDGEVQVQLTYTTDGRTETETRQLGVEKVADGYLISADEGAV